MLEVEVLQMEIELKINHFSHNTFLVQSHAWRLGATIIMHFSERDPIMAPNGGDDLLCHDS